MARVKEERRGRLATLQDLLAGGSKVLVDQAQALRDGLQSRLVDTGRELEAQVIGLVGGIDKQLSSRVDELVSVSLAAGWTVWVVATPSGRGTSTRDIPRGFR